MLFRRLTLISLAGLLPALFLIACDDSGRIAGECVDWCHKASQCEFTSVLEADACFELCDSIEDGVLSLTGEYSVAKYWSCAQAPSCEEYFTCKQEIDELYSVPETDGDLESEAGEETENET